jgi:hypothetical protein
MHTHAASWLLIYPLTELDNAWLRRYLLFFLYSAGAVAEFKELTAAMNVVLKENKYFRELISILRMLRVRVLRMIFRRWLYAKPNPTPRAVYSLVRPWG